MPSKLRPVLLALALTGPGLAPLSAEELLPRGLDFCAAPDKPACMAEDATFTAQHGMAACQVAVRRFAAELGVYRSCLLRTAQHAVVNGNDALAAFRCRAGQKDACPP